MSLRIAILGVAHVHAGAYAHLLGDQLAGVYDAVPAHAEAFAQKYHSTANPDPKALIANSDAVIICSETTAHEELIKLAVAQNKPILCEKPIAITREEGQRIRDLVKDTIFMTAFPCRFSPAWDRVLQRVKAGEIGEIVSICATNHGKCPGGWFVERAKGGGTIPDHIPHTADLIGKLLGEKPLKATAATGKNMQHGEVEDTAMVTFDFANGRFATIDCSWSRPHSYRTWGDVTLNIVGQKGLIEVDLYAQEIEVYQDEPSGHRSAGYKSNLELLLLNEFLTAVRDQRAPSVTLEDGLAANEWVWLALESMAKAGEPVASA